MIVTATLVCIVLGAMTLEQTRSPRLRRWGAVLQAMVPPFVVAFVVIAGVRIVDLV